MTTPPAIAMTTARTTSMVNGRAAPSANSAKVAVLQENVELMTVAAREGGWRLCLLVCWIDETYLKNP